MCRAFKKPTPNQKQNYEPWNNAYTYFHHNNNNHSSPSFQEILNPMHSVLTNQTTSIYQTPFSSNSIQPNAPTSSRFDFDDEPVDLPPLDSPSLSVSLDPEQDNCNDWENMENKLLAPNLIEPSMFSSFPNMPLVQCDEELDAQSQMNHFLGYFPDL